MDFYCYLSITSIFETPTISTIFFEIYVNDWPTTEEEIW